MSFFQNTCKPKGLGGSLMVNMMNIGHSPMAEWGLKHIKILLNYICLFNYLFISSQMSAKPYFIGSTGILPLW